MSRFSTGKAATHLWSAALAEPHHMVPKQPSRKHFARHYPLVMQRAGLTKRDDRARDFETAVFTIFNAYWDARNQPTIAGFREVFDQYAKGQAMVLKALRSLDPIYSEINFAAQLPDLPAARREHE